ncbi:MAG: hypothetical protein EOM11_04545, partial [Erysipelotrichia bacterium]|nr:hypothetical protein [Erysipelotrichia bacterium]
MKKFKFINEGITKEMNVEKIKIIKGQDYHLKYLLYQVIRSSILNKHSEYAQESGRKEFMIDGECCKYKADQFFDVHPYFNIDDDMKMGVKSLSYRYLTSVLSTDIYFDSINTINILFQSLKDEINESDNNFKVDITEFNNQLLVKMLKPFYLVDELETNMYDLNYEEMIIHQLYLIDGIIKNKQKDFIVILNIYRLTEKILNKLICFENTCFLVFVVETTHINDITMMYSLENGGIDFSDLNDLYNLICVNS